jgi:hypothetical protein
VLGDDKVTASVMQRIAEGETGDLFFHAAVLVGGQGKTGGYHEVTIPVPGQAVTDFFSLSEGRARLGQTSQRMAEDADKAAFVLRRALYTFAKGGTYPAKSADLPETRTWVDRFRSEVTDAFFPELWEAMRAEDRTGWRRRLVGFAERAYEEACLSLPTRQQFFYRAHTKGKGLLIGGLRKEFEDVWPAKAAA